MNNKQIFFGVTLMLCNTSFAQEIIIEDPSNYTGSNIIAEGPSNNKIIISIQKDDTFKLNGDVYGAKYTSDNVEKNMVEMQNTIILKNVSGAYTSGHDAIQNTVSLKNCESIQDWKKIVGGQASNGNSKNNKVEIDGGNYEVGIYGGYSTGRSNESSVQGNIVIIKDGTFTFTSLSAGKEIAGGYSDSKGSVNNNSVVVADGDFIGRGNGNAIYGGYANAGADVLNNKVEIYGGNFDNCTITGGYSTSGLVKGNKAYIYGGNFNCNIYAGRSDRANVNGNEIIISMKSDIEKANLEKARLYGDPYRLGNDNKLIIDGWDGRVKGVYNFNSIDFENINWNKDGVVLEITNGDNSLKNTDINLVSMSGGSKINIGESMYMIKCVNGDLGTDATKIYDKGFTAGVSVEGTGTITVEDNGNIKYEITGKQINKQINLVTENRSISTAFLANGSDLLSDALSAVEKDEKYGTKTFAIIEGTNSTYNVSDDLKVNGWNGVYGVGNAAQLNNGKVAYAVFFENGSGNYRTFNSFQDEIFRGNGNLVYNGGGATIRFINKNGVYTEGSFRAGMMKNNMQDVMKDGSGQIYSYKSESNYYGFHLGLGKNINISDDQDIDIYARYYHTYNGNDKFNVGGDDFEIDSTRSNRIRLGLRYNINKENKWNLYYGTAWEHEFDGTSNVKVQGEELPAKSLDGNSYLGEIGFKYLESQESPWNFEGRLSAYIGERRGFSGLLRMTYSF